MPASIGAFTKLPCAVKVNAGGKPSGPHHRPTDVPSGSWFECERVCWDPKDGELCLNRAKPGETLVEARSDSDVQIDREIWV